MRPFYGQDETLGGVTYTTSTASTMLSLRVERGSDNSSRSCKFETNLQREHDSVQA
jgi:hypothetical protein